jgi:polar amino acid transport system substrate-binding protein
MKKRTSFFSIVLTFVLAFTVLAGCSGNQSSASGGKPKLVMGTSADYPPYEFHDTSSGDDKIVGFDVDIANYIAKKLGFQLEIQDMDFNGLLPALQSKRIDFIMAGMTPTEERKKNADFSIIYYDAKNSIVSKAGSNLKKPEDLAGKKVGVQLGSIQEEEAKKFAQKVKGMQIVQLNKIGDLIEEIKSGRIDAAIIEDTVAKGYVQSNPDLQYSTIETEGSNGSAVAFPKGSKYVEQFNKVIKEMQENGEMKKLIKKWFEDYYNNKK